MNPGPVAVLFADDLIETNGATSLQKLKRQQEIAIWFERFCSRCNDEFGLSVTHPDDAPGYINAMYWEQMAENVRPRIIEHPGETLRADRHKIASLMELVIAHVRPLAFDGEDWAIRDLNARFAYYVGLNIIGNWNVDKMSDLHVSDSFAREHVAWLRNVGKLGGNAVFSNAATWYLVEKLYFERFERLAAP